MKKQFTKQSFDEFLDTRARPEVAMAMREGDPMSETEILDAIEENIRIGHMERVGKDKYRMTKAGMKYVEQTMLKPLN